MKKWYKLINVLIIIGVLSIAVYLDSHRLANKKEELINISTLSEEFMDNYFVEAAQLSEEGNEENILIVTSLNGIPNTYGATKVVAAPNHQYFLQYENADAKDLALKELQNSKDIMYVGENIIYTASDTTSFITYNSWGIEKMGLDAAINVSNSNDLPEIVVAIIDSGCNVSSITSNYPGKIKETYNVHTGGSDVTDKSSHGTHVAGTIAEATPSNVKIMPILTSLDDKPNNFANSDIITAINYIVYNEKAQVINMSLGSEYSDSNMKVAIDAARANNIISVVAAGNSSNDTIDYPARYDNNIAVSAIDSNLNLATYSNYGDGVTFTAPGTNIKSVNGTKSGTSMATPHVASVVAIIKSYHPEYTMEQVVDLLKEYTMDLGSAGYDKQFGYGLIHFDTKYLCDLGEDCLIMEDAANDYVYRIEADSFTPVENFGNISNIMNADVRIYYAYNSYFTKKLWELDNVEVIGYDPFEQTIQNVTIRYNNKECTIEIDNRNNMTSSWKYEVIDEDQKTIKITGVNWHGLATNVRRLYVPGEIDGYTVVEIGKDAFKQNDGTYYYHLPASVTTIGDSAFSQSAIVELFSEASSISVNNFAFYLCYSLTNVHARLSFVGLHAFQSCTKLESITFSDDIEVIENEAFSSCINLKNVTFPNSLTTIGSYAFDGCYSFTSINIPKNLTNIGEGAFRTTYSLNTITVDEQNPVYDSRNNSNALIKTETNTLLLTSKNTVIPSSVKIIDSYSFPNFSTLTEVTIPEGVETIKENSGLEYKQKVLLPRSINLIEDLKYYISRDEPKYWIYKDSYVETYLQSQEIPYKYRDEEVFDLDVTLAHSSYPALSEIDPSDVSVSLLYREETDTLVPYTGNITIKYLDNVNGYLNYGDEYIIVKVQDETITMSKQVPINVTQLEPIYEVPEGLVGEKNTLLSSVALPDGFVWKNPSQMMSETGDQVFKATYYPADQNYAVKTNIDVHVMVGEGKEIINPSISIGDKVYDGTTDIDTSSMIISGLEESEYTLRNVVLLNPNVGVRTVAVTLRLTNEKYQTHVFADGSQEKTFTVDFNIVKQAIDKPTLVNKTYTYTGEEQTVELNGFDSNKMNISGNTRTNAGSQNVTISLKNNNYIWSDESTDNVVLTFTINKCVLVPEIAISNKTYDGTTNIDLNTVTVSNMESDDYQIMSSSIDSSSAGNRVATIDLRLSNDKYENYVFANGLRIDSFDVNMVIDPMPIAKPTKVNKSYTYNGEEQTIELNGFNSTMMNISGNVQTNAGSHDVVISLKNGNYIWSDQTTSNVVLTFNISKIVINPNVVISNKTYDGTTNIDSSLITVTNLNAADYTISSASTNYANAGSQTANVTISLTNAKYTNYSFEGGYKSKTLQVGMTIVPKHIQKPTLVNKTYTYNGSAQTVELNNYDSNAMNISGNTRTNAGTWNVTITLKNSNYIWNDETTSSVTLQFIINKAQINVVDNTQDQVYNYNTEGHGLVLDLNDNPSFIVKYRDGSGNYTLDESPTYSAIGSYLIKYKVYIDNNYTEYFGEKTITIANAVYTVTFRKNNGTDEYETQQMEGYANTALRANTFTRDGFTFNSWNTDPQGNGISYTDGQTISIGDDLVLYAQWNETYDFIISNLNVDETKAIIYKLPIGMTPNQFIPNITINYGYGTRLDTKSVNNKEVIYTGGKFTVTKGLADYKVYTLSVLGDVNGDGKIGIIDYIRIMKHIMGDTVLTNEYSLAADMNDNSRIDIIDYIRIMKIIMGE